MRTRTLFTLIALTTLLVGLPGTGFAAPNRSKKSKVSGSIRFSEGRAPRASSRHARPPSRPRPSARPPHGGHWNGRHKVDIDIDVRHGRDRGRRRDDRAGRFIAGMIVGSMIASLPPRHTTVVVGSSNYYYADGHFYQPSGSQYVIVQPPMGAVVPVLPAGYTVTMIGGTQYYMLGGVHYRQAYRGSELVYVVSQP